MKKRKVCIIDLSSRIAQTFFAQNNNGEETNLEELKDYLILDAQQSFL